MGNKHSCPHPCVPGTFIANPANCECWAGTSRRSIPNPFYLKNKISSSNHNTDFVMIVICIIFALLTWVGLAYRVWDARKKNKILKERHHALAYQDKGESALAIPAVRRTTWMDRFAMFNLVIGLPITIIVLSLLALMARK
jgi:hypothetical protein